MLGRHVVLMYRQAGLRGRCTYVKCGPISESTTAATKSHVVPTASNAAGALSAETIEPTMICEQRCYTSPLRIDGAHARGRDHAFVPSVR